jgi:hypothetical protein
LEEYEYLARTQDPQLGVWHNIDALADLAPNFSPYTKCYDNPMQYTDPIDMVVKMELIVVARKGLNTYRIKLQDGLPLK